MTAGRPKELDHARTVSLVLDEDSINTLEEVCKRLTLSKSAALRLVIKTYYGERLGK